MFLMPFKNNSRSNLLAKENIWLQWKAVMLNVFGNFFDLEQNDMCFAKSPIEDAQIRYPNSDHPLSLSRFLKAALIHL